MIENTLMKDALRWASRREYLGKNAIPCPSCKTKQVQLIDYFYVPAQWKCRHCFLKFTFEPVC